MAYSLQHSLSFCDTQITCVGHGIRAPLTFQKQLGILNRPKYHRLCDIFLQILILILTRYLQTSIDTAYRWGNPLLSAPGFLFNTSLPPRPDVSYKRCTVRMYDVR